MALERFIKNYADEEDDGVVELSRITQPDDFKE